MKLVNLSSFGVNKTGYEFNLLDFVGGFFYLVHFAVRNAFDFAQSLFRHHFQPFYRANSGRYLKLPVNYG